MPPMLYILIQGQPGVLCEWRDCHFPCSKSKNPKKKSFRNPNVKVEKFTALLSGAVASTYSMLPRHPKGFKVQHLF